MPYHARMQQDDLIRFRRAYRHLIHELDIARLQQWEQSRVTLPQLRVLHQIRRAPGVTTGELARALAVTVSTMSGLVIKLVDRGLVARTTTPTDRRQAPLYLTEAGAQLVGELSDADRAFLAGLAGRLGSDLDSVTATLERLANATAELRGAPSAPVPLR
jgi:DNA-binding MarR family transcriptional regulator